MSSEPGTRGREQSAVGTASRTELGGGDGGIVDGRWRKHCGLLSRTLVHSSVVKKILPARIRSPLLNDVVFIGETFIELRLLTDAVKLQQQGIKMDFHADIRDAKVIAGAPQHPGVDVEAPQATSSSQETQLRAGLPPDILVLTLDSGYMAFVYARNCSQQEQVDFIVSKQRIDSRGRYPTYLGKSVAVDPRSRAMAVTAYQDNFRLYSLISMSEIQQLIAEGKDINPIKAEKSFEVKGLILHMEFLYPSPNDPEHVILLLFLIDSKRNPRLQLYEWFTTQPLNTAMRYGDRGLRLSEEIKIPLHIIPLTISSAFLIVTESSTFVARAADILSGNATFSQVHIPVPPRGGGLITAWARPIRHPDYAGDHDDIYLAMENGDIYFIEADTKGHNLIQTVTKASHLDCEIDTAFAALDKGLDSHDILVAGGAMSSGGVYLVEIRPFAVSDGTKLEETVTNWAPVVDFDLLNPTRQTSSSTSTSTTIIAGADRDRVYACTGRGDHGAITELRYGVQARILSSADYLPGIIRLFILPDAAGRGYFVLAAFADHSQLLFLDPAGEEEWCECAEEGLGMEEQTLAAGGFDGKGAGEGGTGEWAVQITLNAVTVAELRGERYVAEGMETNDIEPRGRRLQRTCQDGESIAVAAVLEMYVLIVTRSGVLRKEISLNLAAITLREESDEFLTQWGAPVSLDDSPTFVGLTRLGDEQNGRMIALMGTRHATVRLYHCDPAAGLVEMCEQDMMDGGSEDHRESGLFFCESSTIIHTTTAAMMLCGLRNGTLLVFKLEVKNDGSLKLHQQRKIKFGPIPIQIHLDARRKDSAFVLAGPELYRFDLPHDDFRGTQIVFKDTPSDPEIQAIVQVNNSSNTDNIIVGAMRDQIFYADIGQSERLCGRRLRLYETPRRMLYFRHRDQRELKVFVVACSKKVAETVAYSTLRFLDPISGTLRGDAELIDLHKKRPIFNIPNEQIFALTELKITVNGQHYQYIAVGTGVTTPPQMCTGGSSPRRPTGRFLLLSLTCNQDTGRVEVRRRFKIACDAPVYSIAQYGEHSFVYSAGPYVHMKSLKDSLETKKIADVARTYIRSPAVHITVEEPHINLSCAEDSLLVLTFDPTTSSLTESFSDEVARPGFFHTPLSPGLTLTTDKYYGLVGLLRPEHPSALQSLITVFDAELASSISRVRKGRCRAPWSRANCTLPGVIPVHFDSDSPSTSTSSGDNGDEDGRENASSMALIAGGIDGSFYQLTLLTRPAVRLLKIVQQLYERRKRYGFVPPSSSATSQLPPPIETRGITYIDDPDYDDDGDNANGVAWDPQDAHVDGDLLVPVLRLERGWLEREIEGEGALRAAFEGVVRRVWRGYGEGVMGEEIQGDNVCAWVEEWVRGLLVDAVL